MIWEYYPRQPEILDDCQTLSLYIFDTYFVYLFIFLAIAYKKDAVQEPSRFYIMFVWFMGLKMSMNVTCFVLVIH